MLRKLALAGTMTLALGGAALAQGWPWPTTHWNEKPHHRVVKHPAKPAHGSPKPSHARKPAHGFRVGGASPGWIAGQVPSAAQWNAAFASKLDEQSAFLPGLSASVQASGTPGLDGGQWYHYTGGAWTATPTLRIDRNMSSGTAPTAGQTNSWPWANVQVVTKTNPSNIGFETGVSSWLYNSANASTAAQNVSGEFVALKEAWGTPYATTGASGTGTSATITFSGSNTIPVGHSVWVQNVTPTGYNGTYKVTASSAGSVTFANTTTGAQTVAGTVMDITASSTWALDANCTDATAESDPSTSCIGAEIDNQSMAGTTDANRQRVILQLEASGGHTGMGIFSSTKGGATIDNAWYFNGSYVNGIDFSNGTFSGNTLILGTDQKICFDGDACTRWLYWDASTNLTYHVPGGTAFAVGDGGTVTLNAITANSANPLKLTGGTGQYASIGVNGTQDVYKFDTSGLWPTNDNLRDLGSSSFHWKNGWFTGTVSAGAVISSGTVPTTNTGTCTTVGTATGGSTAGKFATTASCSLGATIVLSGLPTATNGYSCHADDNTTIATRIVQTAYTTTSATFTTSAATGTTDSITYLCMGF